MKYKIKIFATVTLIFTLTVIAGEISNKVVKSINGIFGHNVQVKLEKITIPPGIKRKIERKVHQRFYSGHVYLYRIIKNDSTIATAILDNVTGKVMPITFIVYFDKKGKILKTEILKYREQYGGAVSNPKWNKQFTGKDFNSNFVPGKGVDAISGATISVNSVSRGIFKLTLLYKNIFLNNE